MMRPVQGRVSSKRFLTVVAVVVLLFAFTPISRGLLALVHGGFEPTPYSSLAFSSPSVATKGVRAGKTIKVELTNHTGRDATYHWSATQNGALISLGVKTLDSGRTTTIVVPSRGATAGRLQIALAGTNVFLTLPVLKS